MHCPHSVAGSISALCSRATASDIPRLLTFARCSICSPPRLRPADVDATGVHFMNDIIRLLDKEGVKLVLANPTRKVRAQLALGRACRQPGQG